MLDASRHPHPEEIMPQTMTRCPIRQIKFVGIPTRDQDRALEFWTERVGLRVLTDSPMGEGQRWIELQIPGAETGVVLFTPAGHKDRIGTFFNGSFETADVGASYAELKSRGVEFDGEPKKEPWGAFATFRDPDGNQFILSGRG
jgi:catechol 2,3-dioxygenase-like lactoylglutathione lyase family enzyme